ncbi:hypothetical protein T492DRAFT_870139 [Pavlovales sp. CCMP2436]|nr:hypothetical protein T492DRAFT_870139 [Pavlovales sp. CCMP2436]
MVDLQGSLVSKQPLTFHPRAHIGHGGHAAVALLASCRITHAHSVVKTTIQATSRHKLGLLSFTLIISNILIEGLLD